MPDTALWRALDSLADTTIGPTGGLLGGYALRLRDSVPLWWRNPRTRLLPASTQKILTVGAALSGLGPNFRWHTTLWRRGGIREGVLAGDLVLEGGGDPTLGTADGPGLAPLAQALKQAGVRKVQGNLVALDTLTGREWNLWPQGWSLSNAGDGYGGPIAGLNWGQNRTGDRSVREPRRVALTALRQALSRAGIAVTGTDTTVAARGDTGLPRRAELVAVGSVQSPRLADVARICLRESVNPYAEAMVLTLGLGQRGAPREAGRERLKRILAAQGVNLEDVSVDDGSGLSRYDLATPETMARRLARDRSAPPGLRMTDLLARGGQGTLRRRFALLPDPTRVRAKTGTLDGVSALVGLTTTSAGDTVAFALMASGYRGGASRIRRFQDKAVTLLSGFPLPGPAVSDSADSSALDARATARDTSDSTAALPTPGDSLAAPDSTGTRNGTPASPATVPVRPDVVPLLPVDERGTRPVPQDSASISVAPGNQRLQGGTP